MYQNKTLTSIPDVTNQLGYPITVGGSTQTNLNEASPAINYAIKVSLNTTMDVPIGKTTSTINAAYPGQPKIVKNDKGMFVTAYVGIDSIYSNNMTEDPETDGWTDSDGIGEFNTVDKYYNISFADTTFRYIYKDIGVTDLFSEDNDFVIRFSFSLPTVSTVPKSLAGFGIRNSGGESAIGGLIMSPSSADTTYSCYTVRGGTALSSEFLTLYPNNLYTLDIIHSKDTNDTTFKLYGKDGYVGSIVENDFIDAAIEGGEICIFGDPATSGATDYEFKVTGAQVWANTIITKKSIDNCRTWERTYNSVSAAGNSVGECSVAVESDGKMHLAWQYSSGATHYLYYSTYSDGEWSTPENVADNTTIEKLNPVITLSKHSNYAYVAWRELSSSGTDIYFASKDLIYSDAFEILVI